MRTVVELPVHPYAPDGDAAPDWKGETPCACGLPRRHPRHTLPDTPVGDVSERILGEGG